MQQHPPPSAGCCAGTRRAVAGVGVLDSTTAASIPTTTGAGADTVSVVDSITDAVSTGSDATTPLCGGIAAGSTATSGSAETTAAARGETDGSTVTTGSEEDTTGSIGAALASTDCVLVADFPLRLEDGIGQTDFTCPGCLHRKHTTGPRLCGNNERTHA